MATNTGKPEGYSWASPYIIVADPDTALDFYEKAFNLKTKFKSKTEEGQTNHAEMYYKDQVLMFGRQGMMGSKGKTPNGSGIESPISLYLYTENVDTLFNQAVKQGAQVLMEPQDTHWGDRMCALKDLDGHVWSFASSPNAN